jgi:hypothetical protein
VIFTSGTEDERGIDRVDLNQVLEQLETAIHQQSAISNRQSAISNR